jgi:nitrite reductase/ring-hydroxylating ferredoxin subunit
MSGALGDDLMFPLNRWYVAALSSELGPKEPLGRKLLNQKLVLFRDAQGQVRALEDRCSHRGLPLSMGQVEQGQLRCGYHGLLFDGCGRCVEIPGQELIPAQARVQAYAVREQQGVVWIWFGKSTESEPTTEPPQWEPLSDPSYRMRGKALHYSAPWQLIHDNLLDLTHAGYVHARTIGGNPRMHSEAPTQCALDGDVVRVQRRLLNSSPPATFLAAWPFGSLIDRWQQIEFNVSHVTIFAGGMDTGSEDLDAVEPGKRSGLRLPSFHAVTPETQDTCHYLWMVGCNSPRDGVMDQVFAQFEATFIEDKLVIEQQHLNLLHFADAPRISAHFDRAPTLARRLVERLSA